MPQLRVHSISMSLDGYAAGPDQDRQHPLGVGGNRLHTWAFATRGQRKMMGLDGGETGPDDDFIVRGDENIGATIMGRNMFGPIRGEWGDDDWRGWWGPEPPYHHPVFVLTHHPHDPIEMEGGTTFHFVDDDRARRWSRRSRPPAGRTSASAVVPPPSSSTCAPASSTGCTSPSCPTLLGGGERLFVDDLGSLGYEVVEHVPSASVTHVVLARQGG